MSDLPSRTLTKSMEETKQRHKRYLRAMNNPTRRKIIRLIQDGNNTKNKISELLQMDKKTVDWHLNMLENGFCVESKNFGDEKFFYVTKEGEVVEYMDQEKK